MSEAYERYDLPPQAYPSIEAKIIEDYEELAFAMEQDFSGAPEDLEFVEKTREFTEDGSMEYARVIAEIVSGSPPDEAAAAVAYRALHFGHRVATETLGENYDVYREGSFTGCKNIYSCHKWLQNAVLAYLDDNPLTKRLINGLLSQIDPDGRHGYVALHVAASTFMFIDAGQKRKQIFEDQIATFAMELSEPIDWDNL